MDLFVVGYRGQRAEVQASNVFDAKHKALPVLRSRFDLLTAPRTVSDLLVFNRRR